MEFGILELYFYMLWTNAFQFFPHLQKSSLGHSQVKGSIAAPTFFILLPHILAIEAAAAPIQYVDVLMPNTP